MAKGTFTAVLHCYTGGRALALKAIELGLFTELAKGARTAEDLTARLGLHPRSARDFFDALVALLKLALAEDVKRLAPAKGLQVALIQEHDIRASELAKPNPYSTYQIDGLPPTPICNPGRDAIAAVLNPPALSPVATSRSTSRARSFSSVTDVVWRDGPGCGSV